MSTFHLAQEMLDDMPGMSIPCQSVLAEELLPSGMKDQFIDALFDILCQEGFYRLDRATWNGGILPPTASESDARGRNITELFETPDIGLLGNTDKRSDVVSAGEFKHQDAGRSANRASEQVVDTAFSTFSSQINRQSFVAFSLCDPTLRVTYRVPRFVILLTYVAPRWLGYDPNFHVFEDRWLPVVSILFRSNGIQGRGTRIFVVKRDDYYLVLKDSWITHGTPTDGGIHGVLQDRGHLGVTQRNSDLVANLLFLAFVEAAHAYLLDSEKNLEYVKLLGFGQQPISKYLLDINAHSMVGGHEVVPEGVFILP
ncbi:hypothetical protein EDD15DRAFT_2358606 [Pisolithus albus]|nr:hypothetical protein EDD15DRAFT_2358606 [Pisolithus albus]